MDDINVKNVCDKIRDLFFPEKLIIFSQKQHRGVVTSFKLCAVIKSENVFKTEHDIYLKVDSEIPFDVIVYSPEEWEKRLRNETSFASEILKKGTEYHA